MSPRPNPPLKCLPSTPTGPYLAKPAPTGTGGGAAKGVAEGVPTAVRPDQQTGDGRYAIAWLTISAPAARSRPQRASARAAATGSPPATAKPSP